MNKDELQFLLNKYHIRPRKDLGQNFLIDEDAIFASIEAANITANDTIVEIGPGLGVLTAQLAERAARVVAIEPDRDVLPALNALAQQYPSLEIHNNTIQKVNLEELGLSDGNYKLVSNLPYNISSWVLRQFTEVAPRPSTMVIMLQKEVAERVVKKPGKMSVLSCAVQLYAVPTLICQVPRDSFMPVPNVDSAILKTVLRDEPLSADPRALMRLINMGFASKRKQLHNNLTAGLHISAQESMSVLEQCGIEPTTRAQELSLIQWETLRTTLDHKV